MMSLDFNYRPDLRQVHLRLGDLIIAIDDRELLAMLNPNIIKVDPQLLVPEDKPLSKRLTRKIVI